MNSLLQDGWEPTGNDGQQWWQKGFRRQVQTEMSFPQDLRLYRDNRKSSVLATVPAGTQVTVLQGGDDWLRVQMPTGQVGYLFGD